MAKILVQGSHGILTVDSKTGNVLAYDRQRMKTEEYADIARLDITEYQQAYSQEKLRGGDILDFGFWTKAGAYVPASEEFRAEIKAQNA